VRPDPVEPPSLRVVDDGAACVAVVDTRLRCLYVHPRMARVHGVPAERPYVIELERAHARMTLLNTAAVCIGTTLDLDTTCRELTESVVGGLAGGAVVELVVESESGYGALPGSPRNGHYPDHGLGPSGRTAIMCPCTGRRPASTPRTGSRPTTRP